MTIDQIREVFANKPVTADEKVKALFDFDVAFQADGRDGVQDLSCSITDAALEWAEILAERDTTPAETELATEAIGRLRIWSKAVAEKGDHQKRIWSGIQQLGEEAIKRIAAADDSAKPTTRREYENFLKVAGRFSKTEARQLAAVFPE